MSLSEIQKMMRKQALNDLELFKRIGDSVRTMMALNDEEALRGMIDTYGTDIVLNSILVSTCEIKNN